MDIKGICAFTAAMTMIGGVAMPQPVMAAAKRISATELFAFQKPVHRAGHVSRSHRSSLRSHHRRATNFPQRPRYHRRLPAPTVRLNQPQPGNDHRIQPPLPGHGGMIIPQPPGDLNRVPPGHPTNPLPPGAGRLPGSPIMSPK